MEAVAGGVPLKTFWETLKTLNVNTFPRVFFSKVVSLQPDILKMRSWHKHFW